MNEFLRTYKQPVWQNTLQESVGCFVLILVLPGSVETHIFKVKSDTVYLFYRIFIPVSKGTKIIFKNWSRNTRFIVQNNKVARVFLVYNIISSRLLFLLVFAVKPDIVDVGGDVIVAQSRRLTLTCYVTTGSPTPSVTWYINGSLAADAPRSPEIDPTARTLIIRSTTHEDSGRYTCIAANPAGNDVIHFDVHVIGMSVSRAMQCVVHYLRTVSNQSIT